LPSRSLERDVRATMTRLAGNKTILIVSHRLPIVAFADRIYVMLKGEIVEQGPHAKLMRREGLYARLFGVQDLKRTLGMSLRHERLNVSSLNPNLKNFRVWASSFILRPAPLSGSTRSTTCCP
jgi:ABC-type multidrug transport system ATPase subunit